MTGPVQPGPLLPGLPVLPGLLALLARVGTAVERRLYRLLLHLYPRAFREAYSRDLLETFAAQRDEPRYRGLTGALAFWRDIAGDLAPSVVRVRANGLAHRVALRRQRRALDAALARSRQAAASPHASPHRTSPAERSVLDVMLHDLRYSLRLLARRPGFTAVAILSLALGLGGTAIIFGVVDGVVLRPFAYPQPERLLTIAVSYPRLDAGADRFVEAISPAEVADIRGLRSLAHVQAFDLGNRHVSGGDQPERLFTASVFGDLFPTIGLRPHLGRGFTAEETAPNGRPAAVISHRVWRTRFGGDPAVVGRTIRVNGTAVPVVGVMPPELLVLGTDLWLPIGRSEHDWTRNRRQFTVLARLAPAATLTQANAELAALASRTTAAFGREFKEYEGWRLTASPWADALTRSIQPAAWLMLGAIGVVLLIVCVNIANLQLARATTRQREMAVRVALGAGRWRIGRQLLVESLLLAGAGSALGLLIAVAGLRAVSAGLVSAPPQIALLDLQVLLNGRVLIVSLFAAVVSGVLVGVLPAVHAMRADPYDALKGDSRSATAGRATHRLRYGLIVAEMGLAMILLVGAGLLTRTMIRLAQVEPGVDVRNVLTMRLTLPREKYQGPAIPAFFEQLVERVEAIPGVRTAAAANQYPPGNVFTGWVRFEGRPPDPAGAKPQVDTTIASAGLFRTLGIPLRAGRGFTAQDDVDTPRVTVVNESFVRRFSRNASPIGQRVATSDAPDAPWYTIVGVVADTRGRGLLSEPRPEIYLAARQHDAWNQLYLLVRTEGDPRAQLPSVRQAITALDPDQPAYGIRTLEEAFASSISTQRLLMTMLALFAGLAVTLAAIGIYAVMSYAVTARTQEIGIRMALGAGTRTVMSMVVRQVLVIVGLGIALGLTGALAFGRLVTSVLVDVAPNDPVTLIGVAALLASVALLAGYLPARRASRIDPIVALRLE